MISLIKKNRNNKGDNGSSCLTPSKLSNASESTPPALTRSRTDEYIDFTIAANLVLSPLRNSLHIRILLSSLSNALRKSTNAEYNLNLFSRIFEIIPCIINISIRYSTIETKEAARIGYNVMSLFNTIPRTKRSHGHTRIQHPNVKK